MLLASFSVSDCSDCRVRPIPRQNPSTSPITADFEPCAHVWWPNLKPVRIWTCHVQGAKIPASGIAGGWAGLKVDPETELERAAKAMASSWNFMTAGPRSSKKTWRCRGCRKGRLSLTEKTWKKQKLQAWKADLYIRSHWKIISSRGHFSMHKE